MNQAQSTTIRVCHPHQLSGEEKQYPVDESEFQPPITRLTQQTHSCSQWVWIQLPADQNTLVFMRISLWTKRERRFRFPGTKTGCCDNSTPLGSGADSPDQKKIAGYRQTATKNSTNKTLGRGAHLVHCLKNQLFPNPSHSVVLPRYKITTTDSNYWSKTGGEVPVSKRNLCSEKLVEVVANRNQSLLIHWTKRKLADIGKQQQKTPPTNLLHRLDEERTSSITSRTNYSLIQVTRLCYLVIKLPPPTATIGQKQEERFLSLSGIYVARNW
ncbi:hypothetical protein CDAR_85041 [Caerostris darwini]|uniref:Uncharacterized protein n=1 Tax=Caerostris darwini TaxID=1538125 RepID=A0AAV4N327_9ARAC|nr:hypothetical protein CDAR_85041 [Caerostris darwini]